MDEAKWLEQLKANEPKLREFMVKWHPLNLSGWRQPGLSITAPNAEIAASRVRESIRRTTEGDPGVDWDEAIKAGDCRKLNNLLNAAWFGVPESTSCWNIPGFREAVELMEDPPEKEEVSDDTGNIPE